MPSHTGPNRPSRAVQLYLGDRSNVAWKKPNSGPMVEADGDLRVGLVVRPCAQRHMSYLDRTNRKPGNAVDLVGRQAAESLPMMTKILLAKRSGELRAADQSSPPCLGSRANSVSQPG